MLLIVLKSLQIRLDVRPGVFYFVYITVKILPCVLFFLVFFGQTDLVKSHDLLLNYTVMQLNYNHVFIDMRFIFAALFQRKH